MGDDQEPKWRVTRVQRTTARSLRRNQTEAEQRLWQELRANRLGGLGFRRQHPVGPYVVDFVCLPANLVIVLDGGQHYTPEGEARDARRGRFIAGQGLRVLRFSNLDVLNNMSGVLETILAAALLALALPPPHPSPASGRGSGIRTSGKGAFRLEGKGQEREIPTDAAQADQDRDDDI